MFSTTQCHGLKWNSLKNKPVSVYPEILTEIYMIFIWQSNLYTSVKEGFLYLPLQIKITFDHNLGDRSLHHYFLGDSDLA